MLLEKKINEVKKKMEKSFSLTKKNIANNTDKKIIELIQGEPTLTQTKIAEYLSLDISTILSTNSKIHLLKIRISDIVNLLLNIININI
jgi:predicted transcriptional regulator